MRDAHGTVVADAGRVDRGIATGTPFIVPLRPTPVPAGTMLAATIRLLPFRAVGADPVPPPKPLLIAAHAGVAALTVVTPPAQPDGLRMVMDGQSVIYQRLHALPRARWASSTVVEPDPARRLALMGSGTLPAEQVLLDAPGPPASGQPATVEWVEDGMDEMTLRVTARGDGYLVLADAIQQNWVVTVDGAPATIRPAEYAFVAVAVPAGVHEVHFAYPAPASGIGLPVSAAAALLLLAAVGLETGLPWWRRRRTPIG